MRHLNTCRYCDHWHEGAGFMTHHFALTMAMEVAVRSVNPMVTIPYWDFTVEGEAIFDVSGGTSSYITWFSVDLKKRPLSRNTCEHRSLFPTHPRPFHAVQSN